MIKGIVNRVIKLQAAVIDTESAVSPFAKWVIKLEVGPPGQAARIMIPMAISGCKVKTDIKVNPIKGNNTNWQIRPNMMALGRVKMAAKSRSPSDKPIPNIMMINDRAKMALEILSITTNSVGLVDAKNKGFTR